MSENVTNEKHEQLRKTLGRLSVLISTCTSLIASNAVWFVYIKDLGLPVKKIQSEDK